MNRSWVWGFAFGVGAYFVVQHFTGYGKSGSRGPYNG